MGGNKTLKKFKDSKIPKKGGGIANEIIPIYAESNTYSKVIGYIKKGQKLYWDRKSISQDNEWVNFGPEHQC